MKTLLIALILIWQTIEVGFANNPSVVEVNLPSNVWSKEANDLELAALLVRPSDGASDGNSPHDTLEVYVKNTSNYPYIFDPTYDDLGIKIFYLDSSGTEKTLREYKYKEEGMMLSGKVPLPLYPDTTILIKIDIYPKEVPLLTENSVICSFKVFDTTNKQKYTKYTIKSSPIHLVETPNTSPNK